MYERSTLRQFSDFDLPLSRRTPKGVYFVRVPVWSDAIRDGVWHVHELARQRGVVIEGGIPNPDAAQLAYLTDQLGADFEPTAAFAERALGRWMPRMGPANRAQFAQALEKQYALLAKEGKPLAVTRNVYMKLMCWLYYRFERLVPLLGEDDAPKLLYEGAGVTRHELMLLNALSALGADVLLLEPTGEDACKKADPSMAQSQLLPMDGAPFPKDFSLKSLRKEMARAVQPAPRPAVDGAPNHDRAKPDPAAFFLAPSREMCTNAWLKAPDAAELATPVTSRGDDPALYYNAFIRLTGVQDRLTYVNELYRLYQRLINAGRTVIVVDAPMPSPEPEALSRMRRRGSYQSWEEMTVDLATNLPSGDRPELTRLMQRAFRQVMALAAKEEPNLNRLLTQAVCLLVTIGRYHARLFHGWKENQIPAFILMGGCREKHEALYARFLARLPVDVLECCPNLDQRDLVEDSLLLDITGGESLPTMKFPRDNAALSMGTAAANAQRDLDSLLYSDTGLYRSQQFSRANAIQLATTYDEIFILWEQALRYRPNFSTEGDTVNMPVVYAKLSGVGKGDMAAYWQSVRRLTGEDTIYAPERFIDLTRRNPFMPLAVRSVRNGRILRDVIRQDRQYPFALLREAMQEHIFDKLQQMLDARLIRGTFENGAEYAVVATALNLDKRVLRMLQAFDFTKKNPKLVYVNTREEPATLEDAILIQLLSLIGFDIALFVPTGYQTVERFMSDRLPVEHQLGPYMYDQTIPDLDSLPAVKHGLWERILGVRS